MANVTARRKRVKYILIVFFIAAITSGIFLSVDYSSYMLGNRSQLFGTLDNYNQNQTLEFDSLNLKVTKLTTNAYPAPSPPARTDCTELFVHQPSLIPGVIPFFDGGEVYSKCQQKLGDYNRTLQHYKDDNNLIVNYSYANVASKPLDLANYKINLIANTPLGQLANLNYDEFRKPCDDFPTSTLLKSNPLEGCITSDIPKSYRGPLVLSVTRNGHQKVINLNP